MLRTGVKKAKAGRFQNAFGGTFFFDEIDGMTLKHQRKLLTVLSSKKECRVGDLGGVEKILDSHLFYTANTNLQHAVGQGGFPEDFLRRISLNVVEIPPLCQRGESDIRELAKTRSGLQEDAPIISGESVSAAYSGA